MKNTFVCSSKTMLEVAVVFLLILVPTSTASLPPSLDLSRLQSGEPGCAVDLQSLKEGLDTGQLWAQTMVDAGVRSPVGLLSQTGVQFGDFDECLTIRGPVHPQFCLFDLAPAQPDNASWSLFKWGVCVPASCSPPTLRLSLQEYMDQETEAQGHNISEGQGVRVGLLPRACTTPATVSSSFTQADLIYSLVLGAIFLVVGVVTVREILVNDYDGVSPPRTLSQCISARHGFHSLFRRDQAAKNVNLSTLYGIHSCAFFFVVLGHRFGAHFYFMQITNYRDVEHMFTDSWFAMWAGHMDLFVDIFFFMSAFLLGVIYYSALHETFISPLLVYLYRLCRIVPGYAVVVFFYATLLRHLGAGPLWNMFMDKEQSNCRQNWWTNLLFINSYVKTEDMCMLQSWYISCDFQLFVVGTLLVFLLRKRPKPAVFIFIIVFLASSVAPFLGTYLFNRPPMLLFVKDFWANPRVHDMFTSIYSQGHYRGTSYIVGLVAGIYVYKQRNQQYSKSRTYLMQVVGWTICLIVYWSGALFYTQSHPHLLISAFYAASFHTVFGIGVALILVSLILGQPTVWSYIFSWSGFVPLSKLSYGVYLLHDIPHFMWAASLRAPIQFGPLELMSWSIADVVLSLIAALVLNLTIETPTRYLIKFLTSGPPETPLPTTEEPQERYAIQDPFDLKKSVNIAYSS